MKVPPRDYIGSKVVVTPRKFGYDVTVEVRAIKKPPTRMAIDFAFLVLCGELRSAGFDPVECAKSAVDVPMEHFPEDDDPEPVKFPIEVECNNGPLGGTVITLDSLPEGALQLPEHPGFHYTLLNSYLVPEEDTAGEEWKHGGKPGEPLFLVYERENGAWVNVGSRKPEKLSKLGWLCYAWHKDGEVFDE